MNRNKIKRYGRRAVTLLLAFAIVTALPIAAGGLLNSEAVSNTSPMGESEAVAPVVVGAAVVAGTALGAAGGIAAGDYFAQSDIDKATDDTLRSSVHTAAISSEGTNEAFLNAIDNDIATIEGSVEQTINRDLIAAGDDVTSETEAVNIAEGSASEYLWTTQTNLEETHNFQAVDVQRFNKELQSTEYGDDIGAVNYTELTGSYSSSQQVTTSSYVELTSDVTITPSSGTIGLKLSNGGYLDLNGHTLTVDSTYDSNSGAVVPLGNTKIVDGTIATGESIPISTDSSLDLQNVTIQTSNTDSIKVDGTVSGVSVWQSGDNLSSTDMGGDASLVDQQQFSGLSTEPVTLDPSMISDSNLQATATTTTEDGESTTKMTAVEVNADPAYVPSESQDDGKITLAVPYTSNGNPITESGMKFVVNTPTSGVSSYANPVDFNEAVEIVKQRDSLATDTYNFASTYASNVYQDTWVPLGPDESVYDDERISKDLGTYTPPDFDPSDPADGLAIYVGTYEGIENPANTEIVVSTENGNVGTVLFSTDIKALTSQTDDPSVIAEGDTFDASQTNRTIMYDTSTGEKTELTGSVTVESVSVNGDESVTSQDIRDYDLASTNLGDQAERVQDQSNVTIEIADTSGGGIGFPDIGSDGYIALAIALAGALLLFRD